MILLRKEQSTDVREYAPIAKALYRMDKVAEETVKRKFDVAYFIAKEGLAFRKSKALCQLEERHGVALGEGYKNGLACSAFVEYIAQEMREDLRTIGRAKFFSLQMDGSTDSANMEEELFLAVYFDPYGSHGSVSVKNTYFCVRQPATVNAPGLYECLNRALSFIGITDHTKLIGLGCDGASVNMGDKALKGLVTKDRPWAVVVWCLAHRLELAVKDAFRGTLFSSIDKLLMRVYYVYSKAPKKCRELDEVIKELLKCLDLSDFPCVRHPLHCTQS